MIYPILAFITGFYLVDMYNICSEKYNNFRRVNKLAATQHTGVFDIARTSVSMIVMSKWDMFSKWIDENIKTVYNPNIVIKLDRNRYLINYSISGKNYKMIVKGQKGPKNVSGIFDENNEDVYAIISEFLGPQENFNNIIYTPEDFNKKRLVFILSNDTVYTFGEKDSIRF